MQKNVLLTGATAGIGLATAKLLVDAGHHVLIHGRNAAKLEEVLEDLSSKGSVETYVADLSDFAEVKAMADAISTTHDRLDVLINNAGVFKVSNPITSNGQDLRFVVNTLSPYLLTKLLLPLMNGTSRVVNLSSAAQAPVDMDAMIGKTQLGNDFQAYAQSKLAITMWSSGMANRLGAEGPSVVAVNPGSLLNTRMVTEAFGPSSKDVGIGANILIRAAFSDAFAEASGKYYDNDAGRFSPPHPFGQDPEMIQLVMSKIDFVLSEYFG